MPYTTDTLPSTRVVIATRHWDHVVPLALGDIDDTGDLLVERHDTTPDLWTEPELDASETSFSRYVRRRAAGDDSVTALPVFLMRGFRHHCIITKKDSSLTSGADLRGLRVGVTGWPDSGNTWTRAVLRREGVGVADVEWRAGALTSAHPIQDRIQVSVPDNVRPTENDEPMVDMLARGALDAVMTPFYPAGFFDSSSPFRTLYRDTRAAELAFFQEVGYIPGMHVLAVKTALLDRDPALAPRLVAAFAASQQLAFQRRSKLLDVTPWQNDAFRDNTAVFGEDFSPIGFAANRAMVDDFQTELVEQLLLDAPVDSDVLFPYSPGL